MTSGGENFVVLPSSSVDIIGEIAGVSSKLPEDISSKLAEDATYRLREVVHMALKRMKRGKRKCLTVDDFSHSLKWNNIEQIYGHGGIDPVVFKSISCKDTTVSYIEEKDVSLREIAFDASIPAERSDSYINGQWLALEGFPCHDGKINRNVGRSNFAKEPIVSYIKHVVAALKRNNSNLIKIVLTDLRCNENLQSALPYLLSYVIDRVMKQPVGDPKNCRQTYNAAIVVCRCLSRNESLFLQPYLSQISKLLLHILLELKLEPGDWDIKRTAALLLGEICRKYSVIYPHLGHKALSECQDLLLRARAVDMSLLFGALNGILAVDCEVIRASSASLLGPIIDRVHDTTSRDSCLSEEDPLVCMGVKDCLLECMGVIVSDRNTARVARALAEPNSNLAEFLSALSEVTHPTLLAATGARRPDGMSLYLRTAGSRQSAASKEETATESGGRSVGRDATPLVKITQVYESDRREFDTSLGRVCFDYKRKRSRPLSSNVCAFEELEAASSVKKAKLDVEASTTGRDKGHIIIASHKLYRRRELSESRPRHLVLLARILSDLSSLF